MAKTAGGWPVVVIGPPADWDESSGRLNFSYVWHRSNLLRLVTIFGGIAEVCRKLKRA